MDTNEITFNNLPQAVAQLVHEVSELKSMFINQQASSKTQSHKPVSIDEACQLIGKAKPTVYALVRKRLIPCYKNGKKLYFFEDELMAWIENGKKKTLQEIQNEADNHVYGAGRNNKLNNRK